MGLQMGGMQALLADAAEAPARFSPGRAFPLPNGTEPDLPLRTDRDSEASVASPVFGNR